RSRRGTSVAQAPDAMPPPQPWLHRIAFVALVAAAGVARARTLDIDGWAPGESVEITGFGNVPTAEPGASLDGVRGFSYGLERGQGIGMGESSGWDVQAPSSDSLLRAGWLVDTFHPELLSFVQSGDEFTPAVTRESAITALQLAIWEVVAEPSGAYSLFDGHFALPDAGASDGALDLASAFLGALADAPLDGYVPKSVGVSSPTLQDQLFTSYTGYVLPIPEPGAIGLVCAGLLLAAFAVRRSASD